MGLRLARKREGQPAILVSKGLSVVSIPGIFKGLHFHFEGVNITNKMITKYMKILFQKPKPSTLKDVTLAEAGKFGTLTEYAFFDKVRLQSPEL